MNRILHKAGITMVLLAALLFSGCNQSSPADPNHKLEDAINSSPDERSDLAQLSLAGGTLYARILEVNEKILTLELGMLNDMGAYSGREPFPTDGLPPEDDRPAAPDRPDNLGNVSLFTPSGLTATLSLTDTLPLLNEEGGEAALSDLEEGRILCLESGIGGVVTNITLLRGAFSMEENPVGPGADLPQLAPVV